MVDTWCHMEPRDGATWWCHVVESCGGVTLWCHMVESCGGVTWLSRGGVMW
jgi:hypothetical protein